MRAWRGVMLLGDAVPADHGLRGRVADWGGVYLSQDLGTSTAAAALAFAAFAAGMTGGRMVGDRLNRPTRRGHADAGRRRARRGCPRSAAAGGRRRGCDRRLRPGRARARQRRAAALQRGRSRAGRESAPNIGAVSSMGSLGFLAGPPFIGFLAEATSLPWRSRRSAAGSPPSPWPPARPAAARSGSRRPGIRCRRPEARACARVRLCCHSKPGRRPGDTSASPPSAGTRA